MKLLMNNIESAAADQQPIYIHGYKVSVFDVSAETAKDYKDATGEEEFEPDCTHTQFDITFVDEAGIRRGLVEIGFEENTINEQPEDEDLLIAAELAEE
jgi:hypothetical protein